MSVRENETPRGSLGWHQGGSVVDGCKRVPADDGSRCGPGIGTPANPTRPDIRHGRSWLVAVLREIMQAFQEERGSADGQGKARLARAAG
jgi:hypothetical protein